MEHFLGEFINEKLLWINLWGMYFTLQNENDIYQHFHLVPKYFQIFLCFYVYLPNNFIILYNILLQLYKLFSQLYMHDIKFLFLWYFLLLLTDKDVNNNNSTDLAAVEGRYIKGDPLNGYYDFIITEGSYKFWVVFQVNLH